jgi:hypothetical protein
MHRLDFILGVKNNEVILSLWVSGGLWARFSGGEPVQGRGALLK